MSLDIAQYVHGEAPLVGSLDWSVPGIDHLSASLVNTMRRCPEQVRQERILGRRGAPGESRVTGSAVHRALERNFRSKIKTGVDLPMADVLDWLDTEGFAEVVAEEERKAEQETIWDTSLAEARARGRAMVGAYLSQVADRIEPVNAEERFTLSWEPIPIIGIIDLETREVVVDFKSSKERRLKPKSDWLLQAVVYGEACQKPVHFHVLSATTKTGAVSITTPLDSEHLAVSLGPDERAAMRETVRIAANEIAMYYELLGPDRPWPMYGRMHEWACGFCSFRPGCPAWSNQ